MLANTSVLFTFKFDVTMVKREVCARNQL